MVRFRRYLTAGTPARPEGLRRLVRGHDAGGSLVEFALSIGLVFAMLFGVIQFSFALYSYHFVNEVARDLSRYALVRGSACVTMPNCGFTDSGATLQAYAQQTYQYPGINMSQVTVTSTWSKPATTSEVNTVWNACASGTGCNAPGDMIAVTVTYPFPLSIPFWKSTTLNVTTTSRMVISQ